MIGFFGAIQIFFAVAMSIASYVLSAVALYSIGKNNGVRYPWLAFVPFAQYYVIGSICEEYRIFGVNIKPLWLILPLLLLLQSAAALIPSYILFLPGLVIGIFMALIMHKFFYMFEPSRAFVLALLCLFGRLTTGLALFIIRDMRLQMSQGAYPYPFGERR